MPLPELLSILNDPPRVLRAIRRVDGLYLVGGFLRDAWSGRLSKDIDLACTQDSAQAAKQVADLLEGHAFELGPRFGTWRVVQGDSNIDISPLHPDGIAADLARRDFTVNALAVRLADLDGGVSQGSLHLHPESLCDLETGTVRMVSRGNLQLDPARILRAYRISAAAGMQIEPTTRACLAELAPLVTDSAAERLHEELTRWLSSPRAFADSLGLCAEDGVLWRLFPGLEDCRGCEQNEFHHLDVWTHTLQALSELDRLIYSIPEGLAEWEAEMRSGLDTAVSGSLNGRGLARLSLLLHDCAKPMTREVQPEGNVSFHGHQAAGATLAAEWLERLKFSNIETDAVTLLVREHLRLGFYSGDVPPSARLVHRFIRRIGEHTPLAVLHGLADCLATRGPLSEGGFEQHLLAAQTILVHYYAGDSVARPPDWLDGNEIMRELGLPPGPLIGQVKTALAEATAAGDVDSRESAREFIARLDLSAPGTDE